MRNNRSNMKQLKYLAPVITLALVLGALATPAYAQGRDTADRFELWFLVGGSNSSTFGVNDFECSPALVGGCDFSADTLTPNFPNTGVVPGRIANYLPQFLATGGVGDPQNGPLFGLHVGWDYNPRVQVELIFLYGSNELAFTNTELVDLALDAFCFGADGSQACGSQTGRFVRAQDKGEPRGKQRTHLVNANYHFRTTGHVVPYVGGGLGWVDWFDGPTAFIEIENGGGVTSFEKSVGDETAIALDFVAGVKFYASRHFGARVEVMDVISFLNLDHTFTTIDVSGRQGTPGAVFPVSGTLEQEFEVNQLIFTGGVFWRF